MAWDVFYVEAAGRSSRIRASGVAIDPGWSFVGVTGISSCEKVGDEIHRLLRVRTQNDILPLQ